MWWTYGVTITRQELNQAANLCDKPVIYDECQALFEDEQDRLTQL